MCSISLHTDILSSEAVSFLEKKIQGALSANSKRTDSKIFLISEVRN